MHISRQLWGKIKTEIGEEIEEYTSNKEKPGENGLTDMMENFLEESAENKRNRKPSENIDNQMSIFLRAKTPLETLVKKVCECLIEKGAAIRPLSIHLSCAFFPQLFESLVSCIDVEALDFPKWPKNRKQKTPLVAAVEKGIESSVEIALQAGANLSTWHIGPRVEGRLSFQRPIHAAARNGRWGVVDILLAHGEHPHWRTPAGETVLRLALRRGGKKEEEWIRRWLTEHEWEVDPEDLKSASRVSNFDPATIEWLAQNSSDPLSFLTR